MFDIAFEDGSKFSLDSGTLGGAFYALMQVRDGNNEEAFHGKAEGGEGDYTIRITNTNYNSEMRLNIPPQGKLTVGNYEYTYTGFQVTKDEETGEYIYEFSLDEREQGLAISNNPSISI